MHGLWLRPHGPYGARPAHRICIPGKSDSERGTNPARRAYSPRSANCALTTMRPQRGRPQARIVAMWYDSIKKLHSKPDSGAWGENEQAHEGEKTTTTTTTTETEKKGVWGGLSRVSRSDRAILSGFMYESEAFCDGIYIRPASVVTTVNHSELVVNFDATLVAKKQEEKKMKTIQYISIEKKKHEGGGEEGGTAACVTSSVGLFGSRFHYYQR